MIQLKLVPQVAAAMLMVLTPLCANEPPKCPDGRTSSAAAELSGATCWLLDPTTLQVGLRLASFARLAALRHFHHRAAEHEVLAVALLKVTEQLPLFRGLWNNFLFLG